MTNLGTKVKYVGKKLEAIKGMTGEVISKSEFDGRPLVTIWFKEIDKKFTVQAYNVEPV